MGENPFRDLPSVDRVAADERLRGLAPISVVDITRDVLATARAAIADGASAPDYDAVVHAVLAACEARRRAVPERLINATGVILHTNLGRAPLAEEAIAAMEKAARGYTDLEFDRATGRRGSRHHLLQPMLTTLTGAEAAIVVNNNAAAVLLALSATAAGREVVISRGELVEIGGGFRIPDVMRQSRARLVEVGTTNRTRLRDFEAAIGERTAALMRVHASNFRVVGFTESVPLEDLAELARLRGMPLIDDIGSGALLDTARFGLAHEPMPQRSIGAGAGLVLFSADKLLGGPQAGIAVGSRPLIERMARHPLARAVRLDKVSIAGLAATLRLYLEGAAEERVPVWRMIGMPLAELERRAHGIAAPCGDAASVIAARSTVGGGSLPGETLATWAVALRVPALGASAVSALLRERGVSIADIASALDTKEWRAKKVTTLAGAFSWDALRQAYATLLDADLGVKRGLRDDTASLQLAVHELCRLAPGARRPATAQRR
jgi:L-seryl-tRNA(Ser) seleniumtransferase